MLQLTHVDGTFDNEPIVWFSDYAEDLGQERNRVTIVVQDRKEVLYCAALKNCSFAKTWLYPSKGYLFKQCRNVAEAASAGHKLAST